tara:strand:+ start:206 stop:625 length:420 start_codon:yes stop_codon:yes gene_type:complete
MASILSTLFGKAAMIGGAAALALIGSLCWQLSVTDSKLDNAREDKRAALAANVTLQQSLEMYQARFDMLDEINTRLMDRGAEIERRADESAEAVEDLADENESVADFLATPVPDELAGLLSASRSGSDNANRISPDSDS